MADQVTEFRYIDVATGIHGHTCRQTKLGRRTRTIGETPGTAGEGAHHTGGGNFTDFVIAGVRHVNVAICINRHAVRIIKRLKSNSAISRYIKDLVFSQSGYDPRSIDFADPVVIRIRHINVAG